MNVIKHLTNRLSHAVARGGARLGTLGLGTKFILLVGSILAVTMSLDAQHNYLLQQRALQQGLTDKTEQIGKFVALVSHEAMLGLDFATLDAYMREITRQEDNVYAVLRSANGTVLSAHLPTAAGQGGAQRIDPNESMPTIAKLKAQANIMQFQFPIRFAEREIGYIDIGVSPARVHAVARANLISELLENLLIIAILAACIYFVFRYHALRPIQHLITGANRAAAGDLDHPVSAHANDELGILTQTFNRMMGALKASVQQKDVAMSQLRDLNATLEKRVDERTASLAAVNKELEFLALHDTLTHLPNRALLHDRLQQNVLAAMREDKALSVLMIDLDHFKEVNDSLGHNAGDVLLQEVAHRLRAQLRSVDTVARLGGDEFAVILPNTDGRGAVLVAQKLLHALEPPCTIDGNVLSIGASIGIATFPDHGHDISVLIRCADVAMYSAKRERNGFAVYQSDDDKHTPTRLSLIGDLRRAIERNELELYYQPKVTLDTGATEGFEALARWRHPVHGFVPPDQFIPLAEQTGLIRPLSLWVLDSALAQCAALQRNHPTMTMAVNLSVRNLQDLDLPHQVFTLLQKWNVKPADLILEITESAVMAEAPHAEHALNALHKMGVQISIDDFGTGYSSLGHLRRFPIDEVKIDRSFIMDMIAHSDSGIIVRSVIDLAHKLGLKVTGEGVETEHVLALLRDLDCDRVQGYHFSRPMPAADIPAWLARPEACTPPRVIAASDAPR